MSDDRTDPLRQQRRILVVSHDTNEVRRISSHVQARGFRALAARDDAAAFNIIDAEHVDGMVVETRAPSIDGLRLLRIARMRNPDVCVILLSSPADVDLSTRGMKEGAHDFQTRPLNLEKMMAVLDRGITVQQMIDEMHDMARRLDRKLALSNLIGASASFVRAYNKILHVCGADMDALIIGESGTGRETVARTIHYNSSRKSGNLVVLDSEGMDAESLGREIFGEEEARAPEGRLEIAEGGTFVIEAIDTLPPLVQARLLRLLRDREYERIGSRKTRRADVRVISIGPATLRRGSDPCGLRADLLDHLRMVTIDMPALRHRRRDIPLLSEHFLKVASSEARRPIEGFKPPAMDRLVRYDWPGNVRELKAVIRGMVLSAAASGPLDVVDLPEEIRAGGTLESGHEIRIPIGSRMAEVERRLIDATLEHTRGDRLRAAQLLGIGLRTLQRRLADYKGSRRGRDGMPN